MINLMLTCSAYPEQYDAFLNKELVGYLRMRHGSFSVECPDIGGDCVYKAFPKCDGSFDDERDYHLRFAVKAIEDWLIIRRTEDLPPPPNVEFRIMSSTCQ